MELLNLNTQSYYKLLENGLPSTRGERKEFKLNEVIDWINDKNNEVIGKLILGKEYTNQEIVDIFVFSPQGGMRRSLSKHALVLFTDHTGKSVYEDKWSKNSLHYTGMGLEGNQDLDEKQNKTLANSESNFIRLYLFETHEPKKHTYAGQVELVDNPYTLPEKDKNGLERQVYKFPIKFIQETISIDQEKIKKAEGKKRKQIRRLSGTELKKKAHEISDMNKKIYKEIRENGDLFEGYRFVKKKEYDRNPVIAEHVKKLANGICQLCDQPAPFEKNGIPFLHSHHIDYLSEGGLDTIDNSIAVCPNCHTQIHELGTKNDKEKLQNKIFER